MNFKQANEIQKMSLMSDWMKCSVTTEGWPPQKKAENRRCRVEFTFNKGTIDLVQLQGILEIIKQKADANCSFQFSDNKLIVR